jgi:hypothetical protein
MLNHFGNVISEKVLYFIRDIGLVYNIYNAFFQTLRNIFSILDKID